VAASLFGHAVLRLFEGHLEILGTLAGVIWGATMSLNHALVRLTWNEWLEGRPSTPVERWEWWSLVLYFAVAIDVWLLQ
jgi:hypothetical protein